MKNLIYIAIISFSLNGVFGQIIQNNGKKYKKIEEEWYKLNSKENKEYRVNTDVITAKFKNHIKSKTKERIFSKLNLKILRKNSLGFIDLKVPSSEKFIETIENLKKSKLFTSIELNTYGKYVISPDDPHYNNQWYLDTIDALEAWDNETGDQDVVISILDSGTDWLHEDMGEGNDSYQNIWLNPGEDIWSDSSDPSTGNGIDDDNNGYIDDLKGWDFDNSNNDSRGPYFHGTHVAGIVGAKTNNATGISGIAGGWNTKGSKLMAVGVGDNAPDASILDDAIDYAAENGADIIQLSLSVGETTAINEAINRAYNQFGVLVVCAAGNNNSSVNYPAKHNNVLAVGGTNKNDQKASFANFGSNLDVSAPAVDIYSTQLNNSYGSSDGTSFSAPQVSGLAAMLLSNNENLLLSDLNNIILWSADEVGGYNYINGRCDSLGYGRINANCAVIQSIPLQLSGALSDDYTRYFIESEEATVQDGESVKFNGHEILINGTFEVEKGGVFEINNTEDFSCQ